MGCFIFRNYYYCQLLNNLPARYWLEFKNICEKYNIDIIVSNTNTNTTIVLAHSNYIELLSSYCHDISLINLTAYKGIDLS